MNDGLFKVYPYNAIFQEEMDALPLGTQIFGLGRFKWQQSKIISVFDRSVEVKEKLEDIEVLKKSSFVTVAYVLLAIGFITMLVILCLHRSIHHSDFIFFGIAMLIGCYFFFLAFANGTVIKNLNNKLIVNDASEYEKNNIKDVLFIQRPKGASGDRAHLVIICNDNSYDRYDVTDFSEIRTIQAFRQWFAGK